MKKILLKFLLPEDKLYEISGDIAERFVEKFNDDSEITCEYKDLQEKMFYWLKCRIFE